MFRTKPENTKIVAILADYIATNSLAEIMTYNSLNSISGINVQKQRYLLQRAIATTEKRLGCIFGTVHGIGIKRLPADETSQVGSHSIVSTRRRTKKTINRMVQVNSNQMSADARQNTALKLAHLNLIHSMADNRRTSTFVAPATADPYAAKKASESGK